MVLTLHPLPFTLHQSAMSNPLTKLYTILVCGLLSAGLGCANYTERQSFASWNYTQVVGRYTKKGEAYRQLNTVMVVGVT